MATIAARLPGMCRLAVLAVVLTGVVVLAAAHVLGWSALVVRSGSMQPSVPVGSLVLARPVQPGEVRVRDVVAVPREIDAAPVLVLHRVIALTRRDGHLEAQLRGDANPVPDPEPDVLNETVRRSVAVVPYAGYAVAAIRAALTLSRLLLIAVGVVALAVIWRRPGRDQDATGGESPPVRRGQVQYAGRVRQSLLLRRPR